MSTAGKQRVSSDLPSGARVEQRNAEVVRQRRAPAPTGEILDRGGSFAVCLGRAFVVPPAVVWEWLTDLDRVRVWLGDSTEGPNFRLAGATTQTPPLAYDVERLERERHLTVAMRDDDTRGAASWRIDVRLTPTEAGTHLMLEQTISDRVAAPSVAAACEFYLDRLVRVCHGRPFTDLDPDDYFLSQGASYRSMFPLSRTDLGTGHAPVS